MQRRLFIVIGIVLLIGAMAAIAFVVFSQQPGGPEELPEGPPEGVGTLPEEEQILTVSVIVARQPIGRGSEFVAGSLGRQEFPANNVPPNAIAHESETIGQIANREIAQGQIILRDYLQDQALGTASEAAFQIPPGHVMVAFPIDRQSSIAYALQEGDFVDVLITFSFVDLDPDFQTILPNKVAFISTSTVEGADGTTEEKSFNPDDAAEKGRFVIENEDFPAYEFPREDQRPRRVAQLTVQSAKVIKVGPWIEEPEPVVQEGEVPPPPPLPDIVSLAVVPQDALVLLWSRQTQARMELALRAARDENASHSSEAVTLQYMLTRFNIGIPPKLEFGIDKSENPVSTSTAVEQAPPPPSPN